MQSYSLYPGCRHKSPIPRGYILSSACQTTAYIPASWMQRSIPVTGGASITGTHPHAPETPKTHTPSSLKMLPCSPASLPGLCYKSTPSALPSSPPTLLAAPAGSGICGSRCQIWATPAPGTFHPVSLYQRTSCTVPLGSRYNPHAGTPGTSPGPRSSRLPWHSRGCIQDTVYAVSAPGNKTPDRRWLRC